MAAAHQKLAAECWRLLESAKARPSSSVETWYIISCEFTRRIKYLAETDGPEEPLPEIVNAPLLEPEVVGIDVLAVDFDRTSLDPSPRASKSSRLKTTCTQGEDFEVWPHEVWARITRKLHIKWDVCIPRAVILTERGTYVVEVQPLSCRVFVAACRDVSPSHISRQAIVAELSKRDVGWKMWKFLTKGVPFERNVIQLAATVQVDGPTPLSVSRNETLLDLLNQVPGVPMSVASSLDECSFLKSDRPIDNSFPSEWKSLGNEAEDIEEEFYDITPASIGDYVKDDGIDLLLLTTSSTISDRQITPVQRPKVIHATALGREELAAALRSGGLVGLQNLGNTCFMNSALQCLSHALPLTRYYLSGEYIRDLNPDNPLGMGGLLAQDYAAFLLKVWTSSASATEDSASEVVRRKHQIVTPKQLKNTIGKFAPNFQGYAQQDAQELLGFLLDGLHEDCNRIVNKPYVESIDATDDHHDGPIAIESWKRHKMRNDSKVVDLFQGQYRSRLECPDCGHVSKTFDPFMYCSLPVPQIRRCAVHFALFVEDVSEQISWPFTFPIPIDYRADSVQRFTAGASSSDDTSTIGPKTRSASVPQIRDVNSRSIEALLEIEAPQIRNAIVRVLEYFVLSYTKPDDSKKVRTEGLQTLTLLVIQSPENEALAKLLQILKSSARFREECGALNESAVSNAESNADGSPLLQNTPKRGRRDLSASSTDPAKSVADESEQNVFFPQRLETAWAVMPNAKIGVVQNAGIWGHDKFVHGLGIVGSEATSSSGRGSAPLLVSVSFSVPNKVNLYSLPQDLDVDDENTVTHTFLLNRKYVAALTVGEFVEVVVETTSKSIYSVLLELDIKVQAAPASFLSSWNAQGVGVSPLTGELVAASLLETDSRGLKDSPQHSMAAKPLMQYLAQFGLITSMSSENMKKMNQVHFSLTATSFWSILREDSEWADAEFRLGQSGEGGPRGFLHPSIWRSVDLSGAALGLFEDLATVMGGKKAGSNSMAKRAVPMFWTPFAPKLLYRPQDAAQPCATVQVMCSKPTTLEDCFAEFTAAERLEGDNKWYCSVCKEFRPALKKMDFWKLPDTLVVHLKRFSQANRWSRSKIQTVIHFPWKSGEYLDLKDFLLPSSPDGQHMNLSRYKLFGVSNHFGNLGGGHYTAHVFCSVSGNSGAWYNFDDICVSLLFGDDSNEPADETIVNEAAYILFYERLGARFE